MLARLAEERLVRLYHQGRIFGGTSHRHRPGGDRRGDHAGLRRSRPLRALTRNMTVHLRRGESVLNIFRQYPGRVTGPTYGRDANVHSRQSRRAASTR